jgi:hypothetical protein
VPVANGSSTLDVGIADDNVLVLHPDRAPATLARWRELGITSVRIHARWVAIAPAERALRRPRGFHPADPADRRYDWSAVDRAVDLAHGYGLKVMLAVTGSGPLWGSREPARGNPRWKPDPLEFAAFAHAVALRYRGRVSRYLIWNEPNQPGWLEPQSSCSRARCTPVAPHLYRALVRAAYPAIKEADPRAPVVIGTLAPRGGDGDTTESPLRPLVFVRAMACVNRNLRPVTERYCRRFRPALADGFSIHPHGVLNAPDQPSTDRDDARMGDLPRVERLLDRLSSAHRLRASGGRFGLYLTEFGYRTNPPDRSQGVALTLQSRWLAQATYIAWRDPRVQNITQYEWRDEPRQLRPGGTGYGWQSGLLFADGRPKPALAAFRAPFFIDRRSGARSAQFWGQARPGGRREVTLLRRRPGQSRSSSIARITTDASGFWARRLPAAPGDRYRFGYRTLDGRVLSPVVAVEGGGERGSTKR